MLFSHAVHSQLAMAASSLEAYHARANKRTQDLFGASSSESFLDANAPTAKRAKLSADSASDSTLDSADVKLSSRILASYSHVKDLPPPGTGRKADSSASLLNRLPSSSNADGTTKDGLMASTRRFNNQNGGYFLFVLVSKVY